MSLLAELRELVAQVLAWSAGRGGWTLAILAAVWVPAAILLIPGSLITFGTGYLLGLRWGTAVVSVGSTAGAVAAFALARTLLRDRVRARLAGRPRFRAVDEAVAREGIRIVILLRLSPVVPYTVQNYAYGATGVRFRDFLLGTWVGMLPGTLLYVYLGAGARTLTEAATGGVQGTAWTTAFFVLGLAATAAATWLVTRAARRALERRPELAGPADA